MSAAPDLQSLGAATERLIQAAFAESLTISAGACAKLLGMNPKQLSAMTDEGLIRAVRRGKVRAYTEMDVRAYLAEGPDLCRETRKKHTAPRTARVIPFSARRGASHERL